VRSEALGDSTNVEVADHLNRLPKASSDMPGTSSCSWPRVDSAALCADHPAHRATRVAPDVIERTPQTGSRLDAGGSVPLVGVTDGKRSEDGGSAALAPPLKKTKNETQ